MRKSTQIRQARKAKHARPKAEPYNRAKHGPGLAAFMSAFDDEDLPDGAWQAVLEEGGEAYAKEFNVRISGFDAFMEYVELSDEFKDAA